VSVRPCTRRSCAPARASSAPLSGLPGAKRDRERRLKASFIITCVGSVAKATLRLANATAWNTNEALGTRRTLLSLGSRSPYS